MRFVLLLIVMAFPVLDLYATVRFARWTGVPVWLWLLIATVAGLNLLRSERMAFRAKTIAAMHGGEPLLRGLLDSGRKVLAGVLLILPGVVSDLVALLLLAFPLNVGRDLAPNAVSAGRGKPIEGSFRRVD
jgi:UPF0716 protein FxsA